MWLERYVWLSDPRLISRGMFHQLLITTSVSNIETNQSTTNTLPSSNAVINVKSIDLVTVISVDDASPNEGQTISYTINVNNAGSVDATNVSLTNLLPTGVTYVSDNSGGSYNSGTGVWTVGSISAGNSASLVITATVDSGTAGDHIDNTITNITATETDTSNTGDVLTASDIRAFMTLIRFDEVYVVYFKCDKKKISEYPNLLRYCADLWEIEELRSTINMKHIKQHYFCSHEKLNYLGIVPTGPNFIGRLETILAERRVSEP